MKNWKVKFVLATSPGIKETIISAKTYSDVKKMLEGQYGGNLRSISSITEIR